MFVSLVSVLWIMSLNAVSFVGLSDNIPEIVKVGLKKLVDASTEGFESESVKVGVKKMADIMDEEWKKLTDLPVLNEIKNNLKMILKNVIGIDWNIENLELYEDLKIKKIDGFARINRSFGKVNINADGEVHKEEDLIQIKGSGDIICEGMVVVHWDVQKLDLDENLKIREIDATASIIINFEGIRVNAEGELHKKENGNRKGLVEFSVVASLLEGSSDVSFVISMLNESVASFLKGTTDLLAVFLQLKKSLVPLPKILSDFFTALRLLQGSYGPLHKGYTDLVTFVKQFANISFADIVNAVLLMRKSGDLDAIMSFLKESSDISAVLSFLRGSAEDVSAEGVAAEDVTAASLLKSSAASFLRMYDDVYDAVSLLKESVVSLMKICADTTSTLSLLKHESVTASVFGRAFAEARFGMKWETGEKPAIVADLAVSAVGAVAEAVVVEGRAGVRYETGKELSYTLSSSPASGAMAATIAKFGEVVQNRAKAFMGFVRGLVVGKADEYDGGLGGGADAFGGADGGAENTDKSSSEGVVVGVGAFTDLSTEIGVGVGVDSDDSADDSNRHGFVGLGEFVQSK